MGGVRLAHREYVPEIGVILTMCWGGGGNGGGTVFSCLCP